jgi:putative endopeptidase
METKIAEANWTRAESRNRDKTYNPATVAELEKSSPGFPWRVYFREAGLDKVERAVVRQNTAFPKLAAIFAETPIPTLKAWLAFSAADGAAPLLSKRFVDANWQFRAKFLNGVEEQRPRWKRAVVAVENAMGEAVGRTYVAEYFPPDSKAKMEKLVADLRAAMKGRIENLQWMGPETKARALEKLSKFGVKIGYSAKWRDYSALVVREGDLVGNAERATKFEWDYDANRIGKPVDKLEWGMTPQTVNAYYTPVKNEIVFPAAILQPPFFDPNADPAINYGGIGAVIGHELSHHFDDQGAKYDSKGELIDWWTPGDSKAFHARLDKLEQQFNSYEPLPGMHVNGKLTMGENVADLAGLTVAHDAYIASLNGKEPPALDGTTGDQRFYLAWAQVWRRNYREPNLRQRLLTDPHSPSEQRVSTVRNLDPWYPAFNVQAGQKLYLAPADRVRIG